ncbi:MAG: hypothetical protein FKY71_12465 [Spiribacter salinus]|uniref:Uncharacterized protein n=1 Tax=Spiribacter salinus TaxID=1335746 RepID=A0A540VPJ3_9GAMM|nr:MAG: hypothetical protein FKY71_12465 [Spiribacter salinus]
MESAVTFAEYAHAKNYAEPLEPNASLKATSSSVRAREFLHFLEKERYPAPTFEKYLAETVADPVLSEFQFGHIDFIVARLTSLTPQIEVLAIGIEDFQLTIVEIDHLGRYLVAAEEAS